MKPSLRIQGILSILTFSLFAVPAMVKAQDAAPGKVVHWLMPEEKLHFFELVGKNFVETDPPVGPVRNIAEFDHMTGALVRYPFGIPMSLIKEIADDAKLTTIVANSSQQSTVTQQYINNGVNINNCDFLIAPSNSYWTRDYGPWYMSDSSANIGIIDFPYNRPSRPDDDEIPKLLADYLGIPWYGMNVTHTGGNYMCDGLGFASSTTLVYEENPGQTQDQIAQKMHDYLGIDTYMVVEDPNGTYIDHIDCWGKFLAPDKIMIRKVPATNIHYAEIEATAAYYANHICSYGYNYRVFRVNTPNDQPYTNSVILNNKVLVPFMNSAWDDSARVAYETAMPGYEVIGFTGLTSAPWESTDALHCRVMGMADLGMLYIRHIPLYGSVPAEQSYPVAAEIIACSDSAVYSDSVLVHYRVNSGSWQTATLSDSGGGDWSGHIPEQPGNSTIQYYLTAADASGRTATEPPMGAADPFSFQTVYTQLTAVPDTLWFLTLDDILEGKTTQLHNYTSEPITITEVQTYGTGIMWMADSMTTWNFPYPVATDDSFLIHVVVGIPTDNPMLTGFLKDSMKIVSSAGEQYVIIMVNQEVYPSVAEHFPSGEVLLGSGYPNPFRNEFNIPFTLARNGKVRIEILDISGRPVALLTDNTYPTGTHKVTWQGTDYRGNRLPAGVYLYRLLSDENRITKRMILMR